MRRGEGGVHVWRIRLSVAQFERLSRAFFAEIEVRFL
jgi:hypothetical protein